MVKPSQRKSIAQRVIAAKDVSIRLAYPVLYISETCYRYEPNLASKNKKSKIGSFPDKFH